MKILEEHRLKEEDWKDLKIVDVAIKVAKKEANEEIERKEVLKGTWEEVNTKEENPPSDAKAPQTATKENLKAIEISPVADTKNDGKPVRTTDTADSVSTEKQVVP